MNISMLKIHVHFFSQKINPKITEQVLKWIIIEVNVVYLCKRQD